jgi:hypothetical protein
MWSLVRQALVGSLAVWSVAAELTFVAEAVVEHDGTIVDVTSELDFVKVPPRQRWQHRSPRRPNAPPGRGGNTKRDTISYSGNWCGASQHSTAQDQIVSSFSHFTAPNLKLRPRIPQTQYAAAWVGIDGASCTQALFQAGVTTVVNANGGQSAHAWWQWYPEASFQIKGVPVKPGDWMSVNVTAINATTGRIVISNVQQGYSVTLNVNNGPRLCRVDTEWIVEDFYDGDNGQQVPFAWFEDLWFVDAAAKTVKGKNIGINGAAMVQLQNENGTLVCKAEKYDNANFVAIAG